MEKRENRDIDYVRAYGIEFTIEDQWVGGPGALYVASDIENVVAKTPAEARKFAAWLRRVADWVEDVQDETGSGAQQHRLVRIKSRR